MQRIGAMVARILMATVLWAVLTPAFAWTASCDKSVPGREAAISASAHDHGGSETSGGCEQGGRHQHGCSGHLLCHLLGVPEVAIRAALHEGGDPALPEYLAGKPRYFQYRLDRPPHAPLLA